MKFFQSLIFILLVCMGFHVKAQIKWTKEELQKSYKTHKGKKIKLEEFKSEALLIFFLSQECPLCQNYSLTINKLQKAFSQLKMIAVFLGKINSKLELKASDIMFPIKCGHVIS
ncbi:redoxin domain-containing protein [Hyphobacterium sp. CCMP332]|nr:redoxin domain-containing protein [Hyphobacterium sp. CCMP332]